jgi:sec-independent protein translocase protein TatA
MFGLGTPELIWIFLILLLLFGAAKLPQIGRSIGKTISEFKKGMREAESEADKEGKKEEGNPPVNKK